MFGHQVCRSLTTYSVGLVLLVMTVSTHAEDWPQWRGMDRLGIWHDTGIIEQFPDEGLKISWRVPIKSGYAGPAVANGRVFVMDWSETPTSRTMDGTERLLALNEETGDVLWTHKWKTSYRMLMASYAIGPRATPTVDGNRVYVVGATGRLFCLDVENGNLLWERDYVADYDLSVPPWGVASAPLIDGSRLLALVGGEPDALVVAFDKHTGEEIWRALDVVAEAGYSAPTIIEAGGARQLIIWHPKGLASLDPETGQLFWEQSFDTADGMTITTPVKTGNYLLVSQLYNGSLMLRLNNDRPTAEVIWQGTGTNYMPDETVGLHSVTATPIVAGNYIYGIGSWGEMRGLDALTGERLWMSDQMTTQREWSTAFFVKNGDRYFVNNDEGLLIMARFSPTGYTELGRTALIEPTAPDGGWHGPERIVNWVHPAYANGHIVHRNDREILRASLSKSDY